MRIKFIAWLMRLLYLKREKKTIAQEKCAYIPTINEARSNPHYDKYSHSYTKTNDLNPRFHHHRDINSSSSFVDDIFELEIIEDGFGSNVIAENIIVDEMIFGCSDNLVEDIVMDEIVLDSFNDDSYDDDWF